jgi:hypothetical protein
LEIHCFVLFCIFIHHWHCAVLNIVILSSGSAAVSVLLTSCCSHNNDYLPLAAFPLAAATAVAIVCSFMNKSVCACIFVSACTGCQSSALQARCAAKLPEQIQQDSHDVCTLKRTSTYSMYQDVPVRTGPCTVIYRLVLPCTVIDYRFPC